jgi:hypothetical protein
MGVGWPEESVLFGEVQRHLERGIATGRLGGSGLEGAEAVLGVGVRVQGRDRLRCSLCHLRRRRRRRRLRRHRSEIRRHLWRRRRQYPRTRTVRLVRRVSEIGGGVNIQPMMAGVVLDSDVCPRRRVGGLAARFRQSAAKVWHTALEVLGAQVLRVATLRRAASGLRGCAKNRRIAKVVGVVNDRSGLYRGFRTLVARLFWRSSMERMGMFGTEWRVGPGRPLFCLGSVATFGRSSII